MSKSRIIVLFSVISFFFVIILAFLIGSFYLFNKKMKIEDSKKPESETNSFRYYHLNTQTKTSSRGIVQLFQNLQPDDFLSYSDSEDSHILISPFGSNNEYTCTGSCYCDSSRSRRVTSAMTVLGRGVLYLAAAVTSGLAVNRAKEHFQQKCTETYSSECDSSFIKSEVDDCDEIAIAEYEELKEFNEMTDRLEPPEKLHDRIYWCRGNCESRKFSQVRATNLAEDTDCKGIKWEAMIEVNCDVEETCLAEAKKKFVAEHLGYVCRKFSLKEFSFWVKGSKKFYDVPLCKPVPDKVQCIER